MKKIVWISSYPKSGNTFLRAMLSAFFYSEDGTFKQDYLKNISEFPRDFFDFKPKNNFLNEVKEYKKVQKKISNTDKKVIFLKTHSANLIINETFPTINKDGTKESPNFEETLKVAEISNCPVIISGGVSSIEDIKKAKTLKNIEGVIVGKAIYDGDIKLDELAKEDA